MDTLSQCPLCKESGSYIEHMTVRDHLASGEAFAIQKCSSCGFLCTNPRPNKLEINNFYKSDRYISHTGRKQSLLDRVYHLVRGRMLRKKLRIISRYLKNNEISLLDYGCGTGEFVLVAEKAGFRATGHEPNPDAATLAREKGVSLLVEEKQGVDGESGSGPATPGQKEPRPQTADGKQKAAAQHATHEPTEATGANMQKTPGKQEATKQPGPASDHVLNSLSPESFQVITLWHVLEHIHNYPEILAEFHRLLNPGGLLVVAVPMANSHDAAYYREYWAAWDVPRHLWHFTPETLEKTMAASGFRLQGRHPLPFDSHYVSLLSEQHKGRSLLSAWPRAMITGIRSNFHARRNKTPWSSEIFVFRK